MFTIGVVIVTMSSSNGNIPVGRGGKTVPALGGHAVAPGDERVRSRRRTRAQPLRLAARQNWHATLPYEPAAAAMESA